MVGVNVEVDEFFLGGETGRTPVEDANNTIIMQMAGSGRYKTEMAPLSKIHCRMHVGLSAGQLDVLLACNQFAGAEAQVLGSLWSMYN